MLENDSANCVERAYSFVKTSIEVKTAQRFARIKHLVTYSEYCKQYEKLAGVEAAAQLQAQVDALVKRDFEFIDHPSWDELPVLHADWITLHSEIVNRFEMIKPPQWQSNELQTYLASATGCHFQLMKRLVRDQAKLDEAVDQALQRVELYRDFKGAQRIIDAGFAHLRETLKWIKSTPLPVPRHV